MDLAEEQRSAAYRMKVHKEGANRPSRSNKNSGAKDRKGSRGSKCSKGKKKKMDLSQIRQSMSTNCCACCTVLAQYMKESGKLISSCLNESPTETRVCELFSELLKVTCNVGYDLYNLLCYFCRLFIVINDKGCKK